MSNIFDLFNKIAAQRENRAANDQPITFIIVGLGNPGPKYETTRHNTGFLATDYIASKAGADIMRSKFKALYGEAVFRVETPSAPAKKTDDETAAPAGASPSYINVRALLLKPQTMMNLSGDAVREAAAFYKISPDHIIVIYDDISLDVGRVRIRRKGSDGGHNGIKDITRKLGTDVYPRIKIGVGQKPHPDYDLADWVLSNFTQTEMQKLSSLFPTVYEGLCKMLAGDIDNAMQLCNGAGTPTDKPGANK